jgi:hypothetical protein
MVEIEPLPIIWSKKFKLWPNVFYAMVELFLGTTNFFGHWINGGKWTIVKKIKATIIINWLLGLVIEKLGNRKN